MEQSTVAANLNRGRGSVRWRNGQSKMTSNFDRGARALLFSFTVLLVCGCGSSAFPGKEGRNCVSQGGRFPKFSLEGHPPMKASKGDIDLTLCRAYRKKTCCDVVQTHAALISLQSLASSGEAGKQCLETWEVLECSICDPRMGVTPGPPLLCPSFCELLFVSCAGAFFSMEPLTQVLMPCGPKDILCGKTQEWASNSSTFCQLAGFSVVDSFKDFQSLEERVCFDGKMESRGSLNSNTDSNQRVPHGSQRHGAIDMLKNWIVNMHIVEQILWAIGGLVLTAGALHLRRRALVKRSTVGTLLRNKLSHQEARVRQQALYRASTTNSGLTREKRSSSKVA